MCRPPQGPKNLELPARGAENFWSCPPRAPKIFGAARRRRRKFLELPAAGAERFWSCPPQAPKNFGAANRRCRTARRRRRKNLELPAADTEKFWSSVPEAPKNIAAVRRRCREVLKVSAAGAEQFRSSPPRALECRVAGHRARWGNFAAARRWRRKFLIAAQRALGRRLEFARPRHQWRPTGALSGREGLSVILNAPKTSSNQIAPKNAAKPLCYGIQHKDLV